MSGVPKSSIFNVAILKMEDVRNNFMFSSIIITIIISITLLIYSFLSLSAYTLSVYWFQMFLLFYSSYLDKVQYTSTLFSRIHFFRNSLYVFIFIRLKESFIFLQYKCCFNTGLITCLTRDGLDF